MFEYSPHWSEWFYVFAPFQIYLMIVAVLLVYGEHGDERNVFKQFFRRISYSLERWTGHAGWSMAGALSGLLMLGTAAIGLYWDVAFHVDYGRDNQLFTPSHTMIVFGLGGLVYSALVAVIFASIDRAEVGFRVGGLRVPWTALALAVFGIGGVAAFPFDALWHEAYGVDVTLWSPSHLQLLAGGGLATIVVWLMLREGRRESPHLEPTMLGRAIEVTILGAVLTGVTIFQGEFDFGVPQFQVVYLPILIAAAAGIALVLGRLALGPWGAVKTAFAYIVIRGVIGLLVAVPFNSTFPRFPLYLVAALVVEGCAFLLGTRNRLRLAAAAGAGIGTLGVLADVIWFGAISDVPPTAAGWPRALVLSVLAGIGGALLGGALARPVPDGGARVPAVAALAGGVVLAGALALPLPRTVGHVEADIRLRTPDAEQSIVEVDLQPADAAESATAFGVVSWQGGGRISATLEEVAPGRFVSSRPLPITGRWKTMIGLQRGSQVMAAPVYFPIDPEIADPGIPALAERHEVFAKNTKYLLREQKSGPDGAANAAYAAIAVIVLAFLAMYVLCAAKASPDEDELVVAGFRAPPAPAAGNGNGHHGAPPDRTLGAPPDERPPVGVAYWSRGDQDRR